MRWKIALWVMAVALEVGAKAGPIYQITQIPVAFPTGVNDSAWVIGFWGTLWTPQTGPVTLAAPTGVAVNVNGINNSGQIAGGAAGVPIIWQPDGSFSVISELGGTNAPLWDINEAGQVVGSVNLNTPSLESVAFVWDPVTGVQYLPRLPGGARAIAYVLNDTGMVAGISRGGVLTGFNVVVWDPLLGMVDVGALSGHSEGEPHGINNQGTVVGLSLNFIFQPENQDGAFVWDATSGIRRLPGLSNSVSSANGISEGGTIVGTSRTGGGNSHAVIWVDGVVLDLNDLLANGGGWELQQATEISPNGKYIVGTGTFNGQSASFLLTDVSGTAIPEPATWMFLLVAFGVALARGGWKEVRQR